MSSRGSKSDEQGGKGTQSKPVESVVASDSDTDGSGDGSDDVVVLNEPEKTVDGQTCRSCRGPDSDEMVQCDQCDGWHHYDCVGVNDEVINQSWSCTNCKTAKWIQRTTIPSEERSTPKDTRKKHNSKRTSSVKGLTTTTPIRSSSGKNKSTQSEPPVLFGSIDNRSVPEPHSSKKQSNPVPLERSEYARQSNTHNVQRKEKLFVPSVDGLPEILLEKAFSEVSCSSSQRSARNRAKLQLLKLQEEREFEERQAERRRQEEAELRRVAEQQEAEQHRQFLAKKYKILQDLASEKGSIRSSTSIISRSRVEEWVKIASCTQLNTVKRSSEAVAHEQALQEEKRRNQKQQEQLRHRQQQDQVCQQQQQGQLLPEVLVEQQQRQNQLQQEHLRQQHQKQLQREQEFRRYQQQQRQEQLKQEEFLLEQQQRLQQEEDRINRLQELQLLKEIRLREQELATSRKKSANSVPSAQFAALQSNLFQENR